MKEKNDLFNSKKLLKKQGYKESIKNVLGIKNFAPVRCDGEDDESIAEYMSLMENQVKLMVNLRNKSFSTKAMDKTFSVRRKFLLEKIRKIEDVKIQYPLLFCYDKVFLIWLFGIVNTNISQVSRLGQPLIKAGGIQDTCQNLVH